MHYLPYKHMVVILLCSLLNGCIALAGGAAVTGVAVAYDRRTTGTIVEDRTIVMKTYRALNSDDEVREKTHINATSFNTILLLTGEAPTEALRDRALALASGVERVSRIYNEIEVMEPSSFSSRSSDRLLATRVKTRLFGEENLAPNVKVVTERGIVYLMGILTPEEADTATNAARTISGVQKVVRLFEKHDEPISDTVSAE
jgi:osmotically-inducible protein OsmY